LVRLNNLLTAVFVFIVTVPGTSLVLGQVTEKSNLDRFVYEVSSIRPDPPGGIGGGARVSFGNTRLDAAHVPLSVLVNLAYGVEDIQVHNMPKWVSGDSFSVEATVAPEMTEALSKLPPPDRSAAKRHMLQTLLADRFHLVVREEKKNHLSMS
jgi:uncharacterized protein (TIGR03435 family)